MQKIVTFLTRMALVVLFVPTQVMAQWDQGKAYAASAGLPQGRIIDIIGATMDWLLAILGFIAVIAFVISGILYLTSAGDEGQIDKAKTGMTYSIIGVIVALLGYIIVQAADTWLRSSSVF